MALEVWREPVRGGPSPPEYHSQPGIERLRALQEGRVPMPPIGHLLGVRLTQVAPGAVTLTQPASHWVVTGVGQIDPSPMIERAGYAAVISTLPPGTSAVTRILSLDYARVISAEARMLVSRARVIHTRRRMSLAEISLEDGEGRLLAHGTAQAQVTPGDGATRPLPVFEPPAYTTPDPYERKYPGALPDPRIWVDRPAVDVLKEFVTGERTWPLGELTGMRLTDFSDGRVTMQGPASAWLAGDEPTVVEGALAGMLSGANTGAALTRLAPGRALALLQQSFQTLESVPADGRILTARAKVVHEDDNIVLCRSELRDEDGNSIGFGAGGGQYVTPRVRRVATKPERVLATIMFTDIVGSSGRAQEMGDGRWAAMLERHDAAVATEIKRHHGVRIKSTGDGVLARFDTPAAAVEAARAIREEMRAIGIEIRAGIHTGECELLGSDIGGIAVHVAARIEGIAQPGEVLVSGTVPGLVAGSGLQFEERGTHELKGVGSWPVLALRD